MARLSLVPNGSAVASVIVLSLVRVAPAAEGRFGSFDASAVDARMHEVAAAVHPDKWPRSSLLRLAPRLSRDILIDPSAVTGESVVYSTWPFKDDTAVGVTWMWERFIEDPEGVPRELPEARRDQLLKNLTDEQRNDPNFVKRRLDLALRRYQESKATRFAGRLRVDMCRAPDANTAQDFLIRRMFNARVPTGIIVGYFSPDHRVEYLGDVAFVTKADFGGGYATYMFVRDNLGVYVDGDEDLARAALPLAMRIDALIRKQPVLTEEQLQALRPVITIAASGQKTRPGKYLVDYSISPARGQGIVSARMFEVGADGKIPVPGREGKIRIASSAAAVRIRVEVITTALLAGAVERDVTLPDVLLPETLNR